MRPGLANAAAALSVFAFIAWLWTQRPDPKARTGGPDLVTPESVSGSVRPCEAPLAWRVDRVDPRFGVDTAAVRIAVERAATTWERIAGRTLFVHDGERGLAVRLSYDARQRMGDELRAVEGALDASWDSLRSRRAALADLEARGATERARLAMRERAFVARLEVHNDGVRAWNSRGGAPSGPKAALLAEAAALDTLREALRARREAVDAMGAEASRVREGVERGSRDYLARAGEAQERFGVVEVEGARYTEVVRRGGAGGLEREIRVWRFDDAGDLERVIAHELGHALGLGHAATGGSIMSERFDYRTRPPSPADARGEDEAMLRDRCPTWFEPPDTIGAA